MSLDNFNDLSVIGSNTSAGFQFEFYCAHCTKRWKSPFKPYRTGQLTGFLSQLTYFFNGARNLSHGAARIGSMRNDSAHSGALEDAQEMAARLYSVCGSCEKTYCKNCYDEREQCCTPCLERAADAGGRQGQGSGVNAGSARGSSGPACPNCQTASDGGRFCGECGFDMASTHKACPACGTMLNRSARFCGDCGHGF